MSVRHRNWQTEKTREKIRVTQLIRRLEKFALGEKDDQNLDIDMSPAQVKAAQAVIDKALPSLASVDQTVENVAPQSEEEMMAQLKEMVAKNPALKDLLLRNN